MHRLNTAVARPDQDAIYHRLVTLTLFPNVGAKKQTVLNETLPELVARIAKTSAADKNKLPMLSGVIWGERRTEKGSLRHKANACEIHAVFIDYDAGEITPEEAVERLKVWDLVALVYTSPSHHMPGKGNRWRIVLPLHAPAPPDAYSDLVARVNGVFGGTLADESFRVAQAYFYGSLEGLPLAQSFVVDGMRCIDEAFDLDAQACGPSRPPSAMLDETPQKAVDQSEIPEAISRALNGLKYAEARVLKMANIGHSRTDELLRQAIHLGGYVACNTLTEEQVRKVLNEAAEEVGYPTDYSKRDLDRHITNGLKLGMARPLPWYDPLDDLPDFTTEPQPEEGAISAEEEAGITDIVGPPTTIPAPVRNEPLARLSEARKLADNSAAFGDVWNGARHADRLRGRRLYVSATGEWLEWTDQRWVAMTPEQIANDAKETSAAILGATAEAFRKDSSGENQAMMTKATKLHGNAETLARMEKMARSEPGMHVASPADFDKDPFSLTCINGIVDLRTGLLRSACPEDRVTKLAGCAFNPDAACPMFESFLETIMPDADIRAFVQRAVGYTLTGLVREEKFFLAYGTGQNGKSVFANIISAMLGEYVVTLGAALITLRKHENEAERMMARLPGSRLALVNETAQGEVFDSSRVKAIASREKLSARKLRHEGFDFMPTHKLWIRTNHLLGSLDSGDGFWRRCTPIPFTIRVPDEEKVDDLDDKIISFELPGVLAWAVRGAVDWASGGLRVPRAIKEVVAQYREETDLLGEWLNENTESDPEAIVSVMQAYSDYAEYCRESGMKPGSKNNFGRIMTDRGFKRSADTKTRRFIGFRLRRIYDEEFTITGDPEADALI